MNRFCSACGAKISEGTRFCASCGQAVGAAEPQVAPTVMEPPPLPSGGKIAPLVERSDTGASAPDFSTAEAFFNTARSLPWKQRPEAWWNTFSVLAGAFGGLLWLAYSSVRGLPKLGFLYNALNVRSRESMVDFLLPVLMLLVVWVKRRALMARVFQFQEGLLRKSLGGRVVTAAVLLGGAYLLAKPTQGAHFGRFAEGVDLVTPMMMFLLPLGLVLFRKESDRMLVPLQPLRRKLGPVMAMGASLAAPFATAHLLYHGFDFSMYPLMHVNLPLGLLTSYALARNPVVSGGPPGLPGPGAAFQLEKVRGCLLFLLLGISCVLTVPAFADDFLRDPFNLNDGLRTNAFAPWLAGLPTAVITVLVNGVEVARVVIQGKEPVKEGETPAVENFQVVVRSTDDSGAMATTLASGGVIRILGHCEKAGAPFPSGTATIRFTQQDARQHAVLTDSGSRGPERCAELRFTEPAPEEPPPEQVTVLVSAGQGGLIAVPVTIQLTSSNYELEVF